MHSGGSPQIHYSESFVLADYLLSALSSQQDCVSLFPVEQRTYIFLRTGLREDI